MSMAYENPEFVVLGPAIAGKGSVTAVDPVPTTIPELPTLTT